MRFRFCQYIPGLPGPDDSCKCGREVKLRSPYCPEHDARVHLVAKAVEGQERLFAHPPRAGDRLLSGAMFL